MTEVMIRRAHESELRRISDLWLNMMREHEAFEPRVRLTMGARSAYQSYLSLHQRSERSRVLIAEREGHIAGFCVAYVTQNLPMFEPREFGYISDLYILPDFQRMGIGGKLVEHVHTWFRGEGMQAVQLQAYRQNEKGQAFWHHCGYEPFFDRMTHNLEDRREL